MTSPYQLSVRENIDAPLEAVKVYLSDLSNFSAWNPFLAMDPRAEIAMSAPGVGVGASYSWSSKRIGSGTMTITGVSDTAIDIHMQFTGRNARQDTVRWVLAPTPTGTEVTWEMFGERRTSERLFVALMRLDTVMTRHFADGLKKLKSLLEP